MSRHRSPHGRRASLPLLSPQFAVAGAGGAVGHRAGPRLRHSRASTSSDVGTFSPAVKVAAAVLACTGVAGAAHAWAQGTPFPDAEEASGWFSAEEPVSIPAQRAPADATIADGGTIAALAASNPAPTAASTALTGPRPASASTASAVSSARESVRDVREEAAARAKAQAAAAASGASAAPAAGGSSGSSSSASAAAAGGAVQIVSGNVTSGFGSRWGTSHQGLDIAAPIGTPIRVPLAGTVISSGPASGFGMWVRVQHEDGTVTVYGHINRSLVSVGQRVAAGDQIAEVGNRGQSTGPHLHLEVLEGGQKVNPQPWLDEHGFRVT